MTTKTNAGSETGCCSGKVVQVSGDRLTSTGENGDEHQYTVAKEATITCDGKPGKLADVKKGATVRMTMCKDDDKKVMAIDCGRHIPELAKS
jgi:hypothetical protein